MSGFPWVGGALHCEGVSVEAIVGAVGTPSYIYSAAEIREQYRLLDTALHSVPHRIHYSVKANSNGAVLALLRSLGAGVDVVSGGELFRVRRAGFTGDDIVFSGVGKTERELEEAVAGKVLLVNVESEGELMLLGDVARRADRRVPVAIRVNPEVTIETPHHYTRTGGKGDKFGIPFDDAIQAARSASSLPGIILTGLDMHIGSQVARIDSYRDGVLRLLELLGQLRTEGLAGDLRYLDIGGGLAVTYDAEQPTDIGEFAAAILPSVTASGLTLIVEPGRFLVGNAGVLATRALYRKRSGGRDYVITDAGMNDLLRPSHYNAYHRIESVRAPESSGVYDIVGPVCESGDFFALGRRMPEVSEGDLLVVRSAGAYGYVMSSTYNSRPRIPEVLVDGDRFAVVAQRESYEQLVAQEPEDLQWRTA
ncbi:MAG: diaminopimelate decarboxylase [Gemmatimonadota bacterium]|nr:diaminopimelate decarboxylase [Gemmatimonadota bacterium]